jgi:SAM-dependent methyltransferase
MSSNSQSLSCCRSCGAQLSVTFVDLGTTPLANSYISNDRRNMMEPTYPLHAYVCEQCFLVQLEEFETPDRIFGDYLYFSSYSESWLRHCAAYVDQVTPRFGINRDALVVEVASNDGYLLQYFVQKAIPVLGIEPAANVAEVARQRGIPTETMFFGAATATELARRFGGADLMVANNVLAHVPDLNDFVAGFRILLKPGGVATFEFPHLLNLIEQNQFDTIYHEHFSYFSFHVAEQVMGRHGLTVFDVETFPTHGGSLRLYVRHERNRMYPVSARVESMRRKEREMGVADISGYRDFSRRVLKVKIDLLEFFVRASRQGKKVVAYGAAAKGNTLLNYCGVGRDLIEFCADRNPHKQGQLLPGSRIPIVPPEEIERARPDYVLILPWNLKEEIANQLAGIREWGGQFVVAIPGLTVF